MKTPVLSSQPRSLTLRLDQGGKRRDVAGSGAQADPHHSRQTPPLEAAWRTEPDVETAKTGRQEPIHDHFRDRELDVAEKSNRQVEVRGRRPPKLGRASGAFLQVAVQRLALRLGQGQPEEQTNSLGSLQGEGEQRRLPGRQAGSALPTPR